MWCPSQRVGEVWKETMHNGENTESVTIESVLQGENLTAAWRAVETNQGAAGVDGMGIKQAREHLRTHWEAIASKLMDGAYRPAAVRAVEIPKPQGGTRTLVSRMYRIE